MPETVKEIDARLKLSAQTIYVWRREGCDLTSEESIQAFALRKRIHYGQRRRNIRRADELPVKGVLLKLPKPERDEQGAAAALKRLQGLEPIFYDRQRQALQTGNSELISYALTDYSKICESLRRYEREVEEAKRDLGHLIPKAEAQNGARAAAIWFRLTWRLWLSSSIPDLLAMADDPRAFKAKAETTFSEVLGVALKNAEGAKCSIPTWAREVIDEEFHVD